jgi:menaquinone-dependent protoporphyrinogen oxidase
MILHSTKSLQINRVLVAFDTRDGQSAEIASRISGNLQQKELNVSCLNLKKVQGSVDMYDGAIFGGPVRFGKHSSALVDFVRRNKKTLQGMPTAFFSVSLAQAGNERERDLASGYIKDFVENVGFQPTISKPIAGALRFPRYNTFLKWLMRLKTGAFLAMRSKRGAGEKATNPDKGEYEFTEWNSVDNFTDEFVLLAQKWS